MIPAHELTHGRPEIASDDEIDITIQRLLERNKRAIESPIRFRQMDMFGNTLMDIWGDEEYASLYYRDSEETALVKPDRLQDRAFNIMRKFGFDENKSEHAIGKDGASEPLVRRDGTTAEFLIYPSQTIEGMVFERMREFYSESGETYHIKWSVNDWAHRFRVNLLMAVLKPQTIFTAANR